MSMNVALMINSLGFGGAERIIADLSVHLERRGMNVFVFVMDTENVAYPYGGQLVPIGFVYKRDSPLMTLISWQHLLGAAIAKRRHKIDVTISAMEYLNLMNVLTGHDKRISTLHNFRFQMEVTPTAKDALIERLFKRFVRRNRAIVCVSRAIEVKARGLYEGVPIQTIYNSIDVDRIHAMMEVQDGPPFAFTDKTFISVGRLAAQKAQDRLLRAFALVYAEDSEARLLILGGGEDEAMLKALAGELGLAEAVTFLGFVHNPFYYMKRCRAFVLSSEYEGFGNVIIEAFACGIPVISTDCRSGPREIIAPDTPIDRTATEVEWAEYGVLTPLSHEHLALAMTRMLQDDVLYRNYAAQAAKRANDFAIDRIVDEWIELLGRVCT